MTVSREEFDQLRADVRALAIGITKQVHAGPIPQGMPWPPPWLTDARRIANTPDAHGKLLCPACGASAATIVNTTGLGRGLQCSSCSVTTYGTV